MKPCYEGLKEIRVDVNDIWRKMLCFRVGIGLLPLILIVSWNETCYEGLKEIRVDVNETLILIVSCYEGLKEIRVDVNEIWRKMLCFTPKYRVVTPYFDCLMKWNTVMKVWKKSELMSMRYEGKCCVLE